jgi:hypothetical protein
VAAHLRSHPHDEKDPERIAELIGDIVATVMENYAHFIRERQAALDESQDAIYDYADADLAHRCEREFDENEFAGAAA